MKHRVLKALDRTGKPNFWLARQLAKIIPHDPRKGQVLIGLIVLALASISTEVWSHHVWVQVAAEPIKAVGVAPACRVLLDFLKWEG